VTADAKPQGGMAANMPSSFAHGRAPAADAKLKGGMAANMPSSFASGVPR
jgi:hypothetical protein